MNSAKIYAEKHQFTLTPKAQAWLRNCKSLAHAWETAEDPQWLLSEAWGADKIYMFDLGRIAIDIATRVVGTRIIWESEGKVRTTGASAYAGMLLLGSAMLDQKVAHNHLMAAVIKARRQLVNQSRTLGTPAVYAATASICEQALQVVMAEFQEGLEEVLGLCRQLMYFTRNTALNCEQPEAVERAHAAIVRRHIRNAFRKI